jgi:glutathione S-transferase
VSDRVVLHRCRTPTNVLCPCGRVARELNRREIKFEERRVPWRKAGRAEVDALTGQDRVPLLVIGREAICDSRRIVEHLRWMSEAKRERSEPGLSGLSEAKR